MSLESKFIEGLSYALPAIITGGVAYFILSKFIDKDNKEKKIEALIAKRKESLPIKLQSYERLLLFCERINPSKLLIRVNPIGEDTNSYLHLILANIEQEFEHNMVQQLYVSDQVWTAVLTAKLALTNKINEVSEKSKNASELRQKILQEYTNIESPTVTAIAFIKEEVKQML